MYRNTGQKGWVNSNRPKYKGPFTLTSTSVVGDVISGKVAFNGNKSGCPGDRAFTGTVTDDGGQLELKLDELAGKCGKVSLKLKRKGAGYSGTFMTSGYGGGKLKQLSSQ